MINQKLQDYIKSGVSRVEGWLNAGAITAILMLDQFQKERGVAGDVAEIGIHHGKLFILLMLLRGGDEAAFAIDVFGAQDRNVDRSGRGDLDIFLNHVAAYSLNDRLIIMQKDSLTLIADDFKNGRNFNGIRLFSVDGSHTARHTKNDLQVAESVLLPEGVIILDDFYNPDWPGVQEGVHSLLSETQALAPFAYGNNKLFLCRNEAHGNFIGYVKNHWLPVCSRSKLVSIHEHPVFHCVLNGVDKTFNVSGEPYTYAIDFSIDTPQGCTVVEGLGKPEHHGRWTISDRVILRLDTTTFLHDRREQSNVELILWVRPYINHIQPSRKLAAFVDGECIAERDFHKARVQTISIPLATSLIQSKKGRLTLEFQVENPTQPSAVSDSKDTRALGFSFVRMALQSGLTGGSD